MRWRSVFVLDLHGGCDGVGGVMDGVENKQEINETRLEPVNVDCDAWTGSNSRLSPGMDPWLAWVCRHCLWHLWLQRFSFCVYILEVLFEQARCTDGSVNQESMNQVRGSWLTMLLATGSPEQ